VTAFADTSGLYALLVATEEGHAAVARAFSRILERRRPLVTTNYVLLETTALLQRRFGLGAVRDLEERITPVCTVRWVTEPMHRRAVERMIRADRRGVSLVDWVSFGVMEAEGIAEALALDEDFEEAGFRLTP
jgi:predicted nucleic acid-binding protein